LFLSITVAAASCPPAAAAATASIEAAITSSCNVFIAGSMVIITGQQQLQWQWGNDQSIKRTVAINQSTAMALGHWGRSNGSGNGAHD
jgi:hypothetical protein